MPYWVVTKKLLCLLRLRTPLPRDTRPTRSVMVLSVSFQFLLHREHTPCRSSNNQPCNSKSKFSQNTNNLLSLKVAKCFGSRVVIRPIIELCLRYIKWKCTFLGSQNVYNCERTWVQLKSIFTILYIIKCIHKHGYILIYNILNINLNILYIIKCIHEHGHILIYI